MTQPSSEAAAQAASPPPFVPVISSIGIASTDLGAFDAALAAAQIANRNLIRLSSVVPAGWTVLPTVPSRIVVPGTWGDRLYVVQAEARSAVPNTVLAAGIGWVFLPEDGDPIGTGLFVEQHLSEEDVDPDLLDQALIAKLHRALTDLVHTRKGNPEKAVFGHLTASATVPLDGAACALVTAIYGAAPWTEIERVRRA